MRAACWSWANVQALGTGANGVWLVTKLKCLWPVPSRGLFAFGIQWERTATASMMTKRLPQRPVRNQRCRLVSMTAFSDLGSNRTSTSPPSRGFERQKLDSKVLSRPPTEYTTVGPLGPSPSVRKPVTRPTVRFQVLMRLNQTISRQTASPKKTTAKQMATSCPGLIGFLANVV